MSVSLNRFSVKYYGSVRRVEMERQRQEKAGKFVIHPHSNFRFFWDVVTLFLLIISILVVPVAITFFSDVMRSDPGWMTFNFVMDFWFLMDIILNFCTGYIKDSGEGDIILDPKVIRIHYLKTWFVIDLLSTFPFDLILNIGSSIDPPSVTASRAVKLFRFIKVASLLRLLRISRLIRYVHQWEQVVGLQYDLAVAAVRVFNLVCLILLIGHWNGCLQFLIPMLNDFPPDSWVIIDGVQNKTWGEQYSWCLFKAMSHMVCIGYGQLPPKNMSDLWITMTSMMSGAVCFAMFIGHITALIQSMDSSERQYKEKYTQVKEYMRYRRLPLSLRDRVFKYYENRYQGKMFDETRILAELSPPLRQDIINFNCRHLVSAVPFFQKAENDFVSDVVQKLKFEIFQPGDVIIKEGSCGKSMYFIQHGVVEVQKEDLKDPIKQLADGCYFGEICLLINGRRVASVVASSYCHLYSLHADDLHEILPHHPVMKQTLEQVAVNRLKHIGHLNEELDERFKDPGELSSEATNLVAEIVKHDQITNESPLRSRSVASSKKDNLMAVLREMHGNDKPRKAESSFCTHKRLHKSYGNLTQLQTNCCECGKVPRNRSLAEMRRSGSDLPLWGSLSRIPNQNNFGLKFPKFSKMRDFAIRPGGIGKLLENRRPIYRRGSPFPINCRPMHRKNIAMKVDMGKRDQNKNQANFSARQGSKKFATSASFTAPDNSTIDTTHPRASSSLNSFVFLEEETTTSESIEGDSGCNFLNKLSTSSGTGKQQPVDPDNVMKSEETNNLLHHV